MNNFGRVLLALFLLGLAGRDVFSQEREKVQFPLSGWFGTRFMSTINDGSLTDYSVMISSLNVKFEYNIKPWLSFKTTGAGLINYGTKKLLIQDPTTGSGPLFESNLWHPRNMVGTTEFTLPEFSLTFKHKSHSLEVGRFVKKTPLINGEKWPFPNAMQGIWYDVTTSNDLTFQAGFVNRISSRFIGEFQKLGNSIGQAGVGVGLDGNKSQYYQVTKSDFLGVVNVAWHNQDKFKIQLWDYFLENISNTVFIESTVRLSEENGLFFSGQVIFQHRVGNGGNPDPELTYFTQRNSNALGFQLSKKSKRNVFELNFNRIGSVGRILIPREWGVEPFYTLIRRTRMEGASDATSLLLKYQRKLERDYGGFQLKSSIGSYNFANPINEFSKNKYLQPSFISVEMAIKFVPKEFMKGASLELGMLHRFLNQNIENDPKYIINRVDFTHIDVIFSYSL
jgi:hypothetical protein